MAITTPDVLEVVDGAGAAVTQAIPGFFYKDADVKVYRISETDGAKTEVLMVQGQDYTITKTKVNGVRPEHYTGSITTVASIPSTENIAVMVWPNNEQTTDFSAIPHDPADFEKQHDLAAMRDQSLLEILKRTVRLPLSSNVQQPILPGPGKILKMSDDGQSVVGANPVFTGSTINSWFDTRDTTSMTSAQALDNGRVFSCAGLLYVRDDALTGTKSVCYDLGVDGIGHFGDFNLRHVGAVCDGVADDTAAWLRAKSYILQLNTGNPVWSNEAVLSDWTGDRHYLPNGVDIFGVGRVNISGEIITDGSDEIVFGINSVLGEPTIHRFSDLRNGKYVAQGLMNGLVVLGNAPQLILRADTTTTDRKSCSYSSFYMGSVPIITLIGIAGPNGSPYINSNNFYGQRGTTLNIQGDYPHNHNMFYGFCFENSTFNFNVGYSNHVKDCRLEGTCVYNASAGTFDNWVFRTYNQFADSYFRQLGATLTTVNNLGGDQGIVDEGDKYYSMETIYAITPDSANYDAKTFERGVSALTCRANYSVFFDSGLIEVKNPFALMIETDQAFWQPFLYAYDSSGNLITTETDVTGAIPSLSWDAANSRFKFGATMGDGAVISVYPDLANGVKFVRYTVGTGVVSGSAFRHFKLKKIERSSKSTVIPIAKPKRKGFHFYGTGVAPVPTAGTWQIGDVVENTNPQELGTSPDKYFTARWHRLTDGSGNVLHTDWRPERVLTGN